MSLAGCQVPNRPPLLMMWGGGLLEPCSVISSLEILTFTYKLSSAKCFVFPLVSMTFAISDAISMAAFYILKAILVLVISPNHFV